MSMSSDFGWSHLVLKATCRDLPWKKIKKILQGTDFLLMCITQSNPNVIKMQSHINCISLFFVLGNTPSTLMWDVIQINICLKKTFAFHKILSQKTSFNHIPEICGIWFCFLSTHLRPFWRNSKTREDEETLKMN